MTDPMNIIETKKLTKKYGETLYALNDVSLTVKRGEWIAVMGPSGSGKSTLMNVLGCLDRATSGHVLVDGTDITSLRGSGLTGFRREKLGLIFQQFHLIPYLTAVENVMLAQYYHSMADETEAREALVRVGLADRLSHLPGQLSGGEQQRVCIARALINHPDIILADEPTGNLDSRTSQEIMELLKALNEREGKTVILVTHDAILAGRYAHRTITLMDGLVQTGSTS